MTGFDNAQKMTLDAILLALLGAHVQAPAAPTPASAEDDRDGEDEDEEDEVQEHCGCAKCTAELALKMVLELLDRAHATQDGEHYVALVKSARMTARAMLALVRS